MYNRNILKSNNMRLTYINVVLLLIGTLMLTLYSPRTALAEDADLFGVKYMLLQGKGLEYDYADNLLYGTITKMNVSSLQETDIFVVEGIIDRVEVSQSGDLLALIAIRTGADESGTTLIRKLEIIDANGLLLRSFDIDVFSVSFVKNKRAVVLVEGEPNPRESADIEFWGKRVGWYDIESDSLSWLINASKEFSPSEILWADSARIYVVAFEGHSERLFEIDLTDNSKRVLRSNGVFRETHPTVSPDGRYLAFEPISGIPGVKVFDLESDEDISQIFNAAFSHDIDVLKNGVSIRWIGGVGHFLGVEMIPRESYWDRELRRKVTSNPNSSRILKVIDVRTGNVSFNQTNGQIAVRTAGWVNVGASDVYMELGAPKRGARVKMCGQDHRGNPEE